MNNFANTVVATSSSPAWRGAYWKVVSCACFAGINGIVRYWSGGVPDITVDALPVNVLMLFQNIFGAFFLLPWILKRSVSPIKSRHTVLHILRIVTAVAGIYLWYLTLQWMPIAEGVALSFTGPIFTVIAAAILLGEKITLQRFLAIFLSIMGAFIISRPDNAFQGNASLGFVALLPLSSAIVLALSKLCTRKLATLGETPTTLAAYLLIFMVPASLLPALFEWVTPSTFHWPWLILLGLLAAIAHVSFSKAYQLAEVTFLTPIGFTKFFLSTFIGFVAFSELPATWTLWVGASIIFVSILLLSHKISLYSWANRFKSN